MWQPSSYHGTRRWIEIQLVSFTKYLLLFSLLEIIKYLRFDHCLISVCSSTALHDAGSPKWPVGRPTTSSSGGDVIILPRDVTKTSRDVITLDWSGQPRVKLRLAIRAHYSNERIFFVICICGIYQIHSSTD